MALKPTRCFLKLPPSMTLALGKKFSPSEARELPESLVVSTVASALQIVRDRAALAHVLSHRTAHLVREALTALASNG